MMSPKFSATDFYLRERLGGGNFGITYEAVRKRSAHLGLTQNLFDRPIPLFQEYLLGLVEFDG